MIIPRYYDNLESYVRPQKVLVLLGPRRVGKTTLIEQFLKHTKLSYKLDSGEMIPTQQVLSSQRLDVLKEYVGANELLVIDEAQQIPNIGRNLKILVDHIPGIRIIATGSSSFELLGQVGEPLVGRKTTLTLFPLWEGELSKTMTPYDLKESLADRLIFGSYPDVITANSQQEKVRLLREISGAYLFKDILTLERVKGAQPLADLLRLLAFQVGSEVSLNELATQLGMSVKTVGRYLDLFEKSFIIYSLRGFSRNLRTEMTQKYKYYFFDTGIRNAMIENFNPIPLRNDIGALWENFLFMERMKKRMYTELHANSYFWRTWGGKEIDLVEEHSGKLFGYEFKWGDKPVSAPRDWIKTYPTSTFTVINKDNYLDFIT